METIPVGRQLGSSNFERQDFHVHEVDLDGVRSLPRVATQLKNEVQMTGDVPFCMYLDAEWSTHWQKKHIKICWRKTPSRQHKKRADTRDDSVLLSLVSLDSLGTSQSMNFCLKTLPWPTRAFQEELHLTELITPGAVAAELKRDAEELGPPSSGSCQRR